MRTSRSFPFKLTHTQINDNYYYEHNFISCSHMFIKYEVSQLGTITHFTDSALIDMIYYSIHDGVRYLVKA